ncbi:MAG: glycosyltransferase family 39 protein [Verrucomicrobiales bacterium]|nr:glycosyltransferase family 39 protein [Verrucomicrobiales bacterium]
MVTSSRVLFFALLFLTACRLALSGLLEATPEECALWEWSRRWSIVGYDGGGLVPLLMKVGGLFGSAPLALRWFAPLCAGATSWVVFRLVRSFSTEKAAAWSVVLLNLLPAFNQCAVLASPEGPAMTFTSLGIFLFWKGLHRAKTWDWHWPTTGGVWALALWASWSAVWLPGCAVFLCAASRRWRGRLFHPGLWLLVFVWALLGFGPFVWWNATHAGAGWAHLAEFSGADHIGLRFAEPLRMLAAAAAGFSPLLLVGVVVASGLAARIRPWKDGVVLLLSFVLPPFAVCLTGSLMSLFRASLLLPLLPAAAALYGTVWFGNGDVTLARFPKRWGRFIPSFHWHALALGGIMSLAALNTDLLRRAGLLHSYQWDVTRDGRGWKETAAEAVAIIREASRSSPERIFLIAADDRLASALDYHLPPELPIFQPDASWPRLQVVESPVPTSQYAFWPRYDAESPGTPSVMAGKTALYFTDHAGSPHPPAAISRAFAKVVPAMVFDVVRDGAALRRIRVFACYGYSGLPF